MPEPRVSIDTYRVSMLPDGHKWAEFTSIIVRAAADGLWRVTRLGHDLSADGQWQQATRRSEEWQARHRFDLETALRLAKQAAPHITVDGGHTVADLASMAGATQLTLGAAS